VIWFTTSGLFSNSRRRIPPSGKPMPGQENSVCTGRTSKAEMAAEIPMTPLMIAALGLLMVNALAF
jgi:hypothetical protein